MSILVGLDGMAVGAEQLDVRTRAVSHGFEHLDAVEHGSLLPATTVDVIELKRSQVIESARLTLTTQLLQRTLALLCVTLAAGITLVLADSVWVLLGAPALYSGLSSLVVAGLAYATLRQTRFVTAVNTGFSRLHGMNPTGQRTPMES